MSLDQVPGAIRYLSIAIYCPRQFTVLASSYSQPFDTALRAYSGQVVDLQGATSGPGIRVADYCPVINQWSLFLSAFAEDRGREHGDECVGRTIRSSESEGGCFAADFAEEMKDTTGLRPWRLHGRGELDSALRSCRGS